MNTPPDGVVPRGRLRASSSPVKEKAFTAPVTLAAERRRMPWMTVEKYRLTDPAQVSLSICSRAAPS
jgi:predicted dithiol-disulfide oxidoreductase (DUF899 family)